MASFAQNPQPLFWPYLHSIEFLHPGYPSGENCIMRLERVDIVPATDPTETQGQQQVTKRTCGVHYGTALVACQIAAVNAFSGRLALDATGSQPVDLPLDAVLLADRYYFFANPDGPADEKYPVVPSFADWQFPHDNIPLRWTQALPYEGSQDQFCILTRFCATTNGAHLVPRQESGWFEKNSMIGYIPGAYSTMHGGANIAPMRADLHLAFDRRMFVVVPKQKQTDGPVQFVGHILDATAAEYMPTVHNIAIRDRNLSAPLLFARFAWAILMRVKRFMLQGPDRVVCVLAKETAGASSASQTSPFTVKIMTGAELQQEYGGSGSLTATSKKRKQDDVAEDDDYGTSDDGDSEYSDHPCPRWIRHADGSLTSVRHERQVAARMEQGITPQIPSILEEQLRTAASGVATKETEEDHSC